MVETAETLLADEELSTGVGLPVDLLAALLRLDHLLERAVTAAEAAYGPQAADDPYRGLYVSRQEVDALLSREPGAPALWRADGETDPAPQPDEEGPRLAWLARVFGLSAFDVDVVLVALAPEVDLRYERLYAYLQDDVTRKRPTVDLALNLLCRDAGEKLARRVHLGVDAPLLRHQLVHLFADPNLPQPPLLAHGLKLDDQIVRLLLGQEGLDPRLASRCRRVEPAVSFEELPLAPEKRRQLLTLTARGREGAETLRLYFHGPAGVGKRRSAEALAGELGVPLLVVDMSRAPSDRDELGELVRLSFREAWFADAVLFLDGVDVLRDDPRGDRYQVVLDALLDDHGITVLSGERPWTSSGSEPTAVLPIAFPLPGFGERRSSWRARLAASGHAVGEGELDVLASRFRLTPVQIAEAVDVARLLPLDDRAPGLAELLAAARAQSGHALRALAHKIEPRYAWDDIVLPEDALAQLREIRQRLAYRHRVLGDWGFDRKLSLGKGINALFAGASGTGKTMAAEVLAAELGLDLYRIDLASVVSKYIGETEKNLDRIFRAAENANAILFFDEADALFGKRSEVRDSHDRYANIEISYLLQKMEQYEGVAILATNLRSNLDEAFTRRLAFTVAFPLPDEASRRRIWAGIWPRETPLADDVDPDLLAHRFKLTGGNIKNVALAAAFLAAEDGEPVALGHVLRAVRREYQKMGKALSRAEIGLFTGDGSMNDRQHGSRG